MIARQLIAPALAIVTTVLSSSLHGADGPPGKTRAKSWALPVTKVAAVSNSFSRDIDEASRTIPPHVWQVVLEAGWRVSLVEYVVEAVPSLRGMSPRGWPAGLKWDNTDAVHLPNSKLLIIAEKRRNKQGQIVACTRTSGVLRHEVGHAFDVLSGETNRFQSAGQSFLNAYNADYFRMNPTRRQELGYYLQRGRAGHEETFAEAFGIIFGGGSDTAHREAFTSAFPRTIECVRQAVAAAASKSRRVAVTPARQKSAIVQIKP